MKLGEKTDSIGRLQDELLSQIKSTNSLESVEFHRLDDLHLSLTRTVVLQHHWIDEFVRSIENSLKNTPRFYSLSYIYNFIEILYSIHFHFEIFLTFRFWIHLNSIQIYCNDNQSRTFISLSLAKQHSNARENLHSIVKQLDNCLMEFKLPAFYQVSELCD